MTVERAGFSCYAADELIYTDSYRRAHFQKTNVICFTVLVEVEEDKHTLQVRL